MRKIHKAASAVALCFVLISAAQAQEDKDRLLPIDAEQVQLTRVAVMPSGLPDRATGIDAPIDMSVGNATAQSMVNSGQVSPAAGAAGGLLGALVVAAIDAGIDANRNGKIERMLAAHSFDARGIFEAALIDALTEGQIKATLQTNERPKDGFFKIIAKPEDPLEASIDVMIRQYGFTVDAGAWRPSVSTQVKVYDTQTGALIMNEYLTYGRASLRPPFAIPGQKPEPGSMAIVVPYDPYNSFQNVDAYTQDEPDRAIATLTVALEDTAKAIARLVLTAGPGLAAASVDAAETETETETELEVSEASIPTSDAS
ncbi:MAG: hypothetical protein CVT79_17555 [Alphaproteobacteria bacterium HGW-Alphaproteobacteria-18]|nr:MAG: hypothetical protein CVT79_17555 [Alphaproteobacteria bacterium HGW-Alphaproteobacteria-18]